VAVAEEREMRIHAFRREGGGEHIIEALLDHADVASSPAVITRACLYACKRGDPGLCASRTFALCRLIVTVSQARRRVKNARRCARNAHKPKQREAFSTGSRGMCRPGNAAGSHEVADL